ncbi:MAG: NmrA family NAD(P)-binding protein [Wenzhouxiangella sp.]|jgi:uncharacterized protein YbjT (DUF2867 family)|nr:NmrA family NAD(P)-binding protein [Wenzhouxiangella sp.]
MDSSQKLAVFGATGTQGHPVVDAALAAGLSVRAISRDQGKAAECLPSSLDMFEGDLLNEASVCTALEGMDAAFFYLPVLPQTLEADAMVNNMISAARAAKLGRLIFTTSAWCSNSMPSGHFVDGLRDMTDRLLASDLDVVILRPTLYLANLVWPHILREIREQGRLTYPPLSSERRVSWTSTEDQGRLVIAALQQARTGEVINVASPEPVTGPELCEMLSRVFGREVHYAPQSVPEFAETLSHMAQSAEVGRLVSALYEGIDELPDDGFVIDAHGLERRFNMRLTPTSKWIQESIGTLLNRFGG